ncbi:hypothetical protein H310_01656 [Aphanomyces invadans]|uniref:Uncharacterized protein n=1 Tax=Aphanomyces invadans TaxID=157072 RepID=A0A024UTK0_9STRA|nr:hypothetical protein H310_01656 [Aphanomyces invadans]ETW09257.1 hypothetical protein H310_01656 [Aphanomyces invadans]|eukprot:XP_008863062.1 hypothetical protein H310_01656 [Aphanomyces invadans]
MASGGLVSALLAAGASSEVFEMGSINLQPYGKDSRPINVTKQVCLGRVQFQTAYGPLLLRGLRAWVDETVPAIELTLGLPVMKILGYTDQGLRNNARQKNAVWDISEESTVVPSTAMHRTLRFGQVDDDIDEDEGMCCATPDLSGSPDTAQIKALLASKVDAAITEGMAPENVSELQAMLLEFEDVFRVSFGRDPPVRVESLKVRLKPGSTPVKSGLACYVIPRRIWHFWNSTWGIWKKLVLFIAAPGHAGSSTNNRSEEYPR